MSKHHAFSATSLYRQWAGSLAVGIALSARSEDVDMDRARRWDGLADVELMAANAMEERIGECSGIDGAMAKLRVAIINAGGLADVGAPPTAEWAMVRSALRDLDTAFPGVAAALGTWADFDQSGVAPVRQPQVA